MENGLPLISVIIPVYNTEKYLPQCIESVLAQTFTDFELLLIDDGSKDSSGSICDEYAKRDHRIRVFHKENGGVSSARNVGLDNAAGAWIAFADSDDLLMPNALQVLYQEMKRTGADIVVANAIKKIGEHYSKPFLDITNGTSSDIIPSIKHFALWGYLIRRDIIANHNIRFIEGLAYSEEHLFLYQIARFSHIITHINTPIYIYRIHEGSVCASKNGYKIVSNQFLAAHYLFQFASIYLNTNKTNYKIITQHAWDVVTSGIRSYIIIEKFSELPALRKEYKKLIGNSLIKMNKLYLSIIKSYAIKLKHTITDK